AGLLPSRLWSIKQLSVSDRRARGDAVEDEKPAENTASKQRGRPFEPGQSGNPKGRPKGSRNRASLIAEQLLDGEVETLTRTIIKKASDGDMSALRFCMERLVPAVRERRVTFELPSKIETAKDAAKASSAILTECADGNLSPNEAAAVMALISSHVRVLEATEIEDRVAELEKKVKP